MSYLIKITAIISLCFSVSCLSKKNPSVIKLDSLGDILADESVSKEEKAEKIALIGEQLFIPTGFMHASDVMDIALLLDPSNKRAQFYKLLLAPKIALKGSLANIKSYIKDDASAMASYNEMLNDMPSPELKKFLLDGSESINTDKDAQALIAKVYKAYDNFRLFLKANKDLQLQLNINSVVLGPQDEQECWETFVRTENNYEIVWDCEDIDPTAQELIQIDLERGDIEALQQITGGIELYLTMFLAYDLSGIKNVHLRYKDQSVDSNVLFRSLLQNKDFGTLTDASYISNIKAIGVDFVTAAKWAESMNSELCPTNNSQKDLRKGKLFENGICIFDVDSKYYDSEEEAASDLAEQKEDFNDLLEVIEVTLKSNPVRRSFGRTIKEYDYNNDEYVVVANNTYETDINVGQFLINPINDIRELGIDFDVCGVPMMNSDSTLGGIFPTGDANLVLRLESTGYSQMGQCN